MGKLTPIIYVIEVVNLYSCVNKLTIGVHFIWESLALDYIVNMLYFKVSSVTPFTVICHSFIIKLIMLMFKYHLPIFINLNYLLYNVWHISIVLKSEIHEKFYLEKCHSPISSTWILFNHFFSFCSHLPLGYNLSCLCLEHLFSFILYKWADIRIFVCTLLCSAVEIT